MQFSVSADSKALVLTGIMHIADYWDMVCCCVHTHSSSSLYSLIEVSYIQSLAIKMKTTLISKAAEDSLFLFFRP